MLCFHEMEKFYISSFYLFLLIYIMEMNFIFYCYLSILFCLFNGTNWKAACCIWFSHHQIMRALKSSDNLCIWFEIVCWHYKCLCFFSLFNLLHGIEWIYFNPSNLILNRGWISSDMQSYCQKNSKNMLGWAKFKRFFVSPLKFDPRISSINTGMLLLNHSPNLSTVLPRKQLT